MLRIYNPGRDIVDDIFGSYQQNFLPFDIEKYEWQCVENIHNAEIIPVLSDIFVCEPNAHLERVENLIKKIQLLNLNHNQKILFLNIWHNDSRYSEKTTYNEHRNYLSTRLNNPFAIVHNNKALNQEIYYDHMWNRQKIYFTNYNYVSLHHRCYTSGADIKNFELVEIKKSYNINMKKILSPIRIHPFAHPRFDHRKKLLNFIKNNNEDMFFYSDNENGILLRSEGQNLESYIQHGGWYPVANHYYNNSFISMFIETITGIHANDGTKHRVITEKTFDPLIKGHFILPYGYKGIVEDIKLYGFKLPEWIDYSYDTIDDDEIRFNKFLEVGQNLLKLSIADLYKLYEKDRDLLLYNREIFWSKPYDPLCQKVKKFFKIESGI
jgi:hypothetical protein